jgi:hypothetical protein
LRIFAVASHPATTVCLDPISSFVFVTFADTVARSTIITITTVITTITTVITITTITTITTGLLILLPLHSRR